MTQTPQWIRQHISAASNVWLFLDYDGTLDNFAPTPDDILINNKVVELIKQLHAHANIRVTIISGRRLSQIESLIPVEGVLLAGTYGIELKTAKGDKIERLQYEKIRPALEELKLQWRKLLKGHEGFFLEDKRWALAIHARFAEEKEAENILLNANAIAEKMIPLGSFRLMRSQRFLEVSPILANKGKTVKYLLDSYPYPEALLIYLGDDDKDEEAFEVIQDQQGITILVSGKKRKTKADFRIKSPHAAREWLTKLTNQL